MYESPTITYGLSTNRCTQYRWKCYRLQKAQKEKEVAEKKAALAKRKADKLAAMPIHKRIKVGIDDVSAENAAKIEAFMLSLS